MAILLDIHPDNPQEHKMKQVIDCLRDGGLIIYPTDTVYGIGCDLYNAKAIEKLCRFKSVKPEKMNLSFICYDLSDLSNYARVVDNGTFRIMKKALPGPFTFILESNKNVPKIMGAKKKQVGIRVPDHNIPRQIVQMLGNPLVTTSVKSDDEIAEYMTDPWTMKEYFDNQVDIIIDAGYGNNLPSTVVDCTDESFAVLRQGAGDLSLHM